MDARPDDADPPQDDPPDGRADGKGRSPEAGRLQALFDAVVSAGGGDRVTVEDALDAVGQSSFGALILVPALVLVSPLSGIPGLPTALGLVIFLVCVQYLVGRDRVWLPARLRRAGLSRARLAKAFRSVHPFVRLLDRLVKPRLTFLINRLTVTVFAGICASLALTFPPLEALPFVATTTASMIALYGFAILARDGFIAILALTATALALTGVAVFVLPTIASLFG
jgi:hypothetical protein